MENPKPPPGEDEAGGLVAAARKFLAACAQWAAARLKLVSIEGREAGTHLVKLLILACALVFTAVLGWFFVCLALVFVLSAAMGVAWAALAVAAAHFAAVAVLALMLKGRATSQWFPLTVEELKKDQAWLDDQKPKP